MKLRRALITHKNDLDKRVRKLHAISHSASLTRFLCTESVPPVYFLPRRHNDATRDHLRRQQQQVLEPLITELVKLESVPIGFSAAGLLEVGDEELHSILHMQSGAEGEGAGESMVDQKQEAREAREAGRFARRARDDAEPEEAAEEAPEEAPEEPETDEAMQTAMAMDEGLDGILEPVAAED